MGWKGESRRHSLARKGIRTADGISLRQIKDIHHFPEIIDYSDPEEFISAFWIASLKNDFSNYDFAEVFDYSKGILEDRLNRYGYLGFEQFNRPTNWYNVDVASEDYIDRHKWFAEKWEELYYDGSLNLTKGKTEDITQEKIDLQSEYAKDVYKILQEEVNDEIYDNIYKVYKKLEEPPTSLEGKIFLMDELIDLQHHRASVWWDKDEGYFLNIDKLRNDFEKMHSRVI